MTKAEAGDTASPGFCARLATLGPVGYWGPAPGTNGSALGLVWALLLAVVAVRLPVALYAVLLALSIAGSVAVCGIAERQLGKEDPGEVILDEFAAVPICFLGLEPALLGGALTGAALLAAGFLLFRIFDIWKPLGIRRLQRLPGGWGVVVDDVAAALVAAVLLHAALWLWAGLA